MTAASNSEATPSLADRIRSEASISDRPGQLERLEVIAAEVERLQSGARTLGHIIEQQGRMVLDVTGMHHVIDETGDGDWAVVWERLYELAPKADAECTAPRCDACGGSGSDQSGPCSDCYATGHTHPQKAQAPLSQPIPAPVDSGAIGRLNEAVRADLAAAIKDSLYEARDQGRTMHQAAQDPRIAAAVERIVREHTDRALAEAWDEAVRECHDLGWLHDFARSDALARNPYRAARQEQGR